MNRLLTASLTALCLAGIAAQVAAAGQSGQAGQGQSAPPAATKTPEQLRYEEELRRYQAEQQRHQQAVGESDEARRRYEAAQARYQRRLERFCRRQAERDEEAEGDSKAACEAAAAQGAVPPGGPVAPAATTGPSPTAGAPPAAPAPAPATAEGESASAAATADAVARCERRNRRRGRRAGGVFGFIARTFTPVGSGVAGAVTAVVPVGELLGEAIAGLLDCDEQQRAAAATEEAVRGGVGTTASWTSQTREGVSGSSTAMALEPGPGGGECMTVTDVVIVDGEETRAPKRLCRRPPSSRFVRV